jgi:hypothetical protein
MSWLLAWLMVNELFCRAARYGQDNKFRRRPLGRCLAVREPPVSSDLGRLLSARSHPGISVIRNSRAPYHSLGMKVCLFRS